VNTTNRAQTLAMNSIYYRHNYSFQSFGASSILLFKAAGCWHAKNRYASKIAPCLVCASSRTVLFPDALATSGVGFVQPSSRSPRSPHLKSHSRQRRPTRLQVMHHHRIYFNTGQFGLQTARRHEKRRADEWQLMSRCPLLADFPPDE
jgi:hypothetical protein